MIPMVLPPLTGLSVLVTRPAPQAALLAASVRAQGGDALEFPAIEIRPLEATIAEPHDLVIFVSVNAVEHGAHRITRTSSTRIAAIGKATAAALTTIELPADIVPAHGFTSEALLDHPDLRLPEGARVLIVRGRGGRDLLQQTFTARGFAVSLLDVYERVCPVIDTPQRDQVEAAWLDADIPVATATSLETLSNLLTLLSERGRHQLQQAALVVPSARVKQGAADLGLRGPCIVAAGADDASIIGALASWHARARSAA